MNITEELQHNLKSSITDVHTAQPGEIAEPMAKVKSRSYHNVAYLYTPTYVVTKYQLPTPYCF